MKIKELQQQVADLLNGEETLVQGGCTALAEDAASIAYNVEKALNQGGVALVVVTPRFTRAGDGGGPGIPVDATIAVQCVEKPQLNREIPGHLTALDAAEAVAFALDGDEVALESIEQTGDERTKTVTATATFNVSIILKQE